MPKNPYKDKIQEWIDATDKYLCFQSLIYHIPLLCALSSIAVKNWSVIHIVLDEGTTVVFCCCPACLNTHLCTKWVLIYGWK